MVDDNSPDGTARRCEELMKLHPCQIKLVERKGKLGLGTAYVEGFKSATGTHVVILDSDLSHHPKYIPEFIAWVSLT